MAVGMRLSDNRAPRGASRTCQTESGIFIECVNTTSGVEPRAGELSSRGLTKMIFSMGQWARQSPLFIKNALLFYGCVNGVLLRVSHYPKIIFYHMKYFIKVFLVPLNILANYFLFRIAISWLWLPFVFFEKMFLYQANKMYYQTLCRSSFKSNSIKSNLCITCIAPIYSAVWWLSCLLPQLQVLSSGRTLNKH